MPSPKIFIGSENEEDDEEPLNAPPKPLINAPMIEPATDDEDDSSSSDVEDMMTAEEEAAAKRYLGGGAKTEERRMSSLDMYLAQPKAEAEPLLINKKLSMRDEQAAIKLDEMRQKEEEEKRKLELQRSREEVKKAREQRQNKKAATNEDVEQQPKRRMNYQKKGFGGLGREKRKKLKEMIMLKAKADLLAERQHEREEKERHVKSVVPPFNIDGLSQQQLEEKLKSMHAHARKLDATKLDWEGRLKKQEEEINELTMKLFDVKGKYMRPVLRKVPRAESMLARLDKLRASNKGHSQNLKEAISLLADHSENTVVLNGPKEADNE